ncbi:MAG: hypothetical protein JRJ68_03290 [Deltaproteobacteria bacterium]|nr:hypothetical protein [Deltaproteobacteria bacterium]
MRDIDILESWGCTSERLQEIFTSTDAESKDTKIRSQWEKLIESRVSNGIGMSCRNARHYQAVDLAWDSTPINKQNIPLQLYAQGKVDVKQCAKYLKDLECSDEFLVKDDKDEVIEIDIPRLHETAVNLVRSFITRRASAQSARFHNLYPYFKYDARGTSVTAKLKSDVLSQRVEIMTDQFGYRRFFSQQAVRDMFLYGYSLTFPTCRWTEEKHLVPTRNNADTPTSIPTSGEDTKGDKGEAKIEKEERRSRA